MSDLPHLEDYVRISGADLDIATDMERERAKRSGRSLAESQKVTKWILIKSLWRGRGTIVFISEYP